LIDSDDEVTSNFSPLHPGSGRLVDVWRKRQKDTGWGYAVAHMIPGVSIYYAFTRRTMTPYLYTLSVSFAITLLTLIIISKGSKINLSSRLMSLPLQCLAAKMGIEKARKYGEQQLNAIKD
jgi:hypothetical protein